MPHQTAVWPREFLSPHVPQVRQPNEIRVFIISRFEPKPWMDTIAELVQQACTDLHEGFLAAVTGAQGKPLEVSIRADRIPSAGVIHAEIWESLAHSDVVVADISGLNANVMFELGAIAVRLPKHRVILLREECDAEERAFDIAPLRHFRYTRSLEGITGLKQYLAQTLLRACVERMIGGEDQNPELPLTVTFQGTDSPWIYTPSECHRRVTAAHLEFGGVDYRQSFLSVASLRLRDVRVTARVRFVRVFHQSPENRSFVGVSLRAEHPYANFSNMLLVREDGSVTRTVPHFEPPQMYRDDILKEQFGVVPTAGASIEVVHEIKGDNQTIAVNGNAVAFSIAGDRIRGAGHIFVQAWMCIVGLERLAVESLE